MELLAPAGSLAAGIMAFDCGADSVYAGLQRFNARERGENFTLDDFNRLVAYARDHGRKVYLTLNTLLKEPELRDAVELLCEVNRFQPHAVIVQDLGVLRIIRECFPALPVHASTQMGIHNSAGVNLLADLGVERVLLERQLTLDEVRETAAHSRLEIEVFGHGALCCSLSGMCLFSSWLGGWSGNRGRCKQPCRRRFFSEDGNGFFFSTQDLYALDLLSEFESIGVAALKLEGRLRGVDYVQHVVTAYRRMLDTPVDQRRAVIGEARAELSRGLGRKWSHGFLDADSTKSLIDHRALGVSGQRCGTVTNVRGNGFEMRPSKPIRVGDRIRIQPRSGDEGPALSVTRLTVNERSADAATPGTPCFVSCDKPVTPDSDVYRIGRDRTIDAARLGVLRRSECVLHLDIDVRKTGFHVRVSGLDETWSCAAALEPARAHALEARVVVDAFRVSGSPQWEAGYTTARVEDGLFIRTRDLRKVRQAFWAWIARKYDEGLPDPSATCRACFETADAAPLSAADETATIVRVAHGAPNPLPGTVTARDCTDEALQPGDEAVLPAFCPESELKAVQSRVTALVARGIRRWRATSVCSLALLRAEKGLTVSAGFPLPAANSMAVRELKSLGANRVAAWVELDDDALGALIEKASGREIFAYGRPTLLTTRAGIAADGVLRDARGQAFRLRHTGGLTEVLPETVMQIPVPPGCAPFIDLTAARPDEHPVSQFNTDREWA